MRRSTRILLGAGLGTLLLDLISGISFITGGLLYESNNLPRMTRAVEKRDELRAGIRGLESLYGSVKEGRDEEERIREAIQIAERHYQKLNSEPEVTQYDRRRDNVINFLIYNGYGTIGLAAAGTGMIIAGCLREQREDKRKI